MEHSFVAGDYSDRDPYVNSRTQERALNSAIVRAEISESFEEYLETFEAFYDDNIEVSSETAEQPIRGKDGVHSLLTAFLVPLHVMAEVGGLSISIRQTAIPGDGTTVMKFQSFLRWYHILRSHYHWTTACA